MLFPSKNLLVYDPGSCTACNESNKSLSNESFHCFFLSYVLLVLSEVYRSFLNP